MGTGMDAQHKMDFFKKKKKTVYVVITQKKKYLGIPLGPGEPQ